MGLAGDRGRSCVVYRSPLEAIAASGQKADSSTPELLSYDLLDDTLVIWGGEFGRTPFLQGKIEETKQWDRDHHPYAFTLWMAGGGVKSGLSYGAGKQSVHLIRLRHLLPRAEKRINAIENKVHVHDFQATVLHLPGIEHERLTYKFQGRHYRLIDVHGHVVKAVLASSGPSYGRNRAQVNLASKSGLAEGF